MTTPGGIALDDDVLTEILLRLPPKSVLRARAVSKHWRDIVTRPWFVAAYSPRRPPEIIVFYDELTATAGNDKKKLQAVGAINFAAAEDNLERRPLLHFHADTLLFNDFCDGLLLFRRGDERLIIWNPATRQGLLLPSPSVTSPQAFVLPFGFYCHRASGEYKVLCHVVEHDEQTHYYILSTSGAEPQRLEDSIAAPTCPGVALHGSLHWLIPPANSSDPDKMIAFDTVSDKFRQMAPPLVPAAGSSCYRVPHLFEMHGLLAASAVRDLPHMDVWVLQDYNRQRWEWRLRISIPQARRMYRPPFTASALGVLDGNVLVVQYGGVVIFYDMVGKRSVSTIDIRAEDMSAVCRQGIYRESLVSLPSTPA